MTALETAQGSGPAVVAGVGSEYRHDDAVGALVSRAASRALGVRDVGPAVDPLDLLGRWDHARLAVIVDAVRSGADPGTVQIMDLGAAAYPSRSGGSDTSGDTPGRGRRTAATSTHGVDVLGVLRLARAVGRAPDRVVLVGIEGEDFSHGIGLSPRVSRALPDAVRQVVSLLQEPSPCA